MVTGEVVNVIEMPKELVIQLGQIGLWLQTLGIIILVWVIAQLVSLWLNRRRLKEIDAIRKDMERIESKIDKLVNGEVKVLGRER